MSSKTVLPVNTVRGSVAVPGDKSISHRAVILAALSNRMCTVENFLDGEDCLCTMEAFKVLDVPIVRKGTSLKIQGLGLEGLKAPTKPIWCGNSGSTPRLLMGVLPGQPLTAHLE